MRKCPGLVWCLWGTGLLGGGGLVTGCPAAPTDRADAAEDIEPVCDAGEAQPCAPEADAGGEGDGALPMRTDVTFTAEDGTALTGFLTAPGGEVAGRPGVVLVHQFQSDDEQWELLPERLASPGRAVLAFNLRGHGDSGAYEGPNLLTDPEGAPRDLQAAIAFLVAQGTDPNRIAVVGTSVGANLAVVSAIEGWGKLAVAISARLPPVEALAASPATGMSGVLYLAGQDDPGGQAADSQAMHEVTGDPRSVVIYPTAAHGIALLLHDGDVEQQMESWLTSHL